MFGQIGDKRLRFEDFRANGLLLPCSERAAIRLGLPLHRGPHRQYTSLVIERVGQIEAGWVVQARRDPDTAARQAGMRIGLLQRALRRYLLARRPSRPPLNRLDPWRPEADFIELDAVAEALWSATAAVVPATTAQPMPVRASNSSRAA